MHEELSYFHLATKEMWNQKRREKIKANHINNYIINKSQEKILFEKIFPWPHLFFFQSTCKHMFRIVC